MKRERSKNKVVRGSQKWSDHFINLNHWFLSIKNELCSTFSYPCSEIFKHMAGCLTGTISTISTIKVRYFQRYDKSTIKVRYFDPRYDKKNSNQEQHAIIVSFFIILGDFWLTGFLVMALVTYHFFNYYNFWIAVVMVDDGHSVVLSLGVLKNRSWRRK